MRTVHNDFKKLKESGIITDYKITTGHFYFFAFITANDEQKSKYYLSVSDVRHFPDNELLIRKVKDYNDYTGGINNYIKLDKEFVDNFLLYLLTNSHKKA